MHSSDKRVSAIDIAIWFCIALALMAWRLYGAGVPQSLGQDSFQYLSVARNAIDGLLGYTSLVHFDAERSFGVVPAPMVTFPPGYPLAIAGLGVMGLPLAVAGLLLSMLSILVCVALLAAASNRLGLSRGIGNALVLAFVVNASVLMAGTKVASDAPFVALTLLGVWLLVVAGRERWVHWVLAGLAFGVAYTMRYAGMFFVVALMLIVARYAMVGDWRRARRYGVTTLIALAFVLGGVARNLVLVGNWRGGNEKVVANPLSSVLLETVRGLNRLLLGPGSGVSGGTAASRGVLVLLVLGWAVWMVWSRRRSRSLVAQGAGNAMPFAVDLLVLAVTYSACLFYAGWKSVIDYGDPRYIVPILPLLLLTAAIFVNHTRQVESGRRRALWMLQFAALVLYGYLNLLILRQPGAAAWLPVAAALDAPLADGGTIRSRVDRLAGDDGVIIANHGQVVGHLLSRRTVSLVGTHFSTTEWNEVAVRHVVRQFAVKAVVVYFPGGASGDDDLLPSAFVRGLARGDAPQWLRLRASSASFRVYEPLPGVP